MRDNLTPGNRPWARAAGHEEFLDYSITFDGNPTEEQRKLAIVWIQALDPVVIKDDNNIIYFTTHTMLMPPEGWRLNKISAE